MQRVKRRIFSGAVCEQVVFNVPDRIKNLDKAEPRPRFCLLYTSDAADD